MNTFKELMETTDWDKYGTGNYDKCSDCMAHCGYEASAVTDVFSSPIKAINVALKGPKTDGPMATEIDLSNSRDPEFVFDSHVQKMLNEIHKEKRALDKINLIFDQCPLTLFLILNNTSSI